MPVTSEAGERRSSPRRLAVASVIAAAAALVGVLLAPESWPEGPGSIRVELVGLDRTAGADGDATGDAPDEVLVLAEPVAVGSAEPLELASRVDVAGVEAQTELTLPEGVPIDAAIEARLRVVVDGEPVSLDVARITISLPDGSEELVPILADDDGDLRARRRPPEDADVALGLLGAAIVLWVSEAVPLFVTSLAIPAVLVVFDVTTARVATAPFADPIIVLFFAGFLLAEAMRRVGLDRLVAVTTVAWAGGGPVTLYAAMIGLAAFGSMWMSNTAAVTVLIPIALAVTAPFDNVAYRKVVVLGLAYAATIGGVGSAIGTPANQIAIKFLDELTGRQISFVEWFGFGLPMLAYFLPIMALYLWFVAGTKVDRAAFAQARAAARAERRQLGRLGGDQLQVLAVFAGVFAGWLTQTWHETHPAIVALIGVVVLAVLDKIRRIDLERISWPTLITFGGGLVLGEALVSTGTADWIVTRLDFLASWPTFFAVTAVAVVALVLTTVASNTASAATLIPLAVPLAGLIGVDPVLLVVIVAIATSVDFALVIGTPPTMMAYSTDLFSAREILGRGAPLDVIGIGLLVTVVAWTWRVLGLI